MSPMVLISGGADPVLSALQVGLDHAELSLRGGSPTEAEQQLQAIWSDVLGCGVPAFERRARFTRAQILIALGRLDDAIIELEDLLANAARDDVQLIRAATCLCHAYQESGDLSRAIEMGERQLDLLRRLQLEGSDDAVRLVVTVAGAYYERGDIAQAVRMCRRAVEQAEQLDTPVARASAYWNASVFESQRGSVDAAVPLAAKALRLLESADEDRGLAQLRSTLGWLQLRLDPPQLEEARANLEAAKEHMVWSSAGPIDLGRNAVYLARAEHLSGDLRGAEERATSVLEQVGSSAPLVRIEALTLLGEVAASRDDAEGAALHYREAALELTRIGSDRGAAAAWFELGELLDELGLQREAHDAYRSAAASTGLGSRYRAQRTGVAPAAQPSSHSV